MTRSLLRPSPRAYSWSAFIALLALTACSTTAPSTPAPTTAASVDATHSSSPGEATALTPAADKLETAGAFAATGIQNTAYQGEGVEQEPELRFEVRYQAPERFSYQIAMGELGFYYYLIEENDKAFTAEPEGEISWLPTDEPMSQGMDLTSAQLLPQFLRNADVISTSDEQVAQRSVRKIEAVGHVADYPAVIFRDFAEQTEEAIPFTALVDADSGELISLELRPTERSQQPGVTYGYVLQLQFSAFGDEVAVAEPSPLEVTP